MLAKLSWSARFRNVFFRSSFPEGSPERLFEERLHSYLPYRLQLVFNENRSTVLSICKHRFSIHRLFLDAPEEVIKELARYARGKKTKPALRRYIQLARYETDHKIELEPQGEVYDLAEIRDELNGNYFDSKLDVQIGWFGKEKKRRRHITFGQYMNDLKAIKIHKLLDDPFYPRFFVAFVVYHEMLHAVIPGYHDERGHYRLHGPEFKAREKEFHAYRRARQWEKANREKIFGWA